MATLNLTQLPLRPKMIRRSTSPLRNLPPEVREALYVACVKLHNDDMTHRVYEKGTPPLLAALRQDSKLYSEALRIFYAINSIRVDQWTFPRFQQQLGRASMDSIRRLHMDLSYPPMTDLYPIIDGFLENKEKGFHLAANTETLVLELLEEPGHITISVIDLAAWAHYFTKLRRFEVRIMTRRAKGGVDMGLINDLIPHINSLFTHAMGKIIEDEEGDVDCMMCYEAWFWEEKDGGMLKMLEPGPDYKAVVDWGPEYRY